MRADGRVLGGRCGASSRRRCSELDFDFLGYADEYLGKVRRRSTTRDFARWLEEAVP